MANVKMLIGALESSKVKKVFSKLCGDKPEVLQKQVSRYETALQSFDKLFPGRGNLQIFSTPGRTEVGGNHSDHNAGRVLAASVDLDVIAVVSANNTDIITVKSEGYPEDIINISNLKPVEGEKYTSAALIRGVCAKLKELGYNIGGFDAYRED